jgi:hypothetical protein
MWNTQSRTEQLFLLLHRDQKSIEADIQAIQAYNFSGQNGMAPLSPRDKSLALRALVLIKPHWDLRSSRISAKLKFDDDGSLVSLEDVAKVGEPKLSKPRTIYFQNTENQKTPSEIPEGAIYLKPNQYQDIRKAKP